MFIFETDTPIQIRLFVIINGANKHKLLPVSLFV